MQQIRREENFESILQFFFTLYSTVLLTLYTNIKKERSAGGEGEMNQSHSGKGKHKYFWV